MATDTSSKQTDDSEQFTERVLDSVETEYMGGQPQYIKAVATWQTGTEYDSASHVETSYSLIARFRIHDGTAELHGFYPETTATGEMLYKHTLKSLQAISRVTEAVRQRVPDDVTVVDPQETIVDLIES